MNLDQKIRELNHRRIDLFRAFKLWLANFVFTPFAAFTDLADEGAILVLRMDDKLGDSVTATGFLRELKKQYAGQKLIVAVGPSTAPLYQKLSFIDEVIISKKGILNTLVLFLKLNRYRYNYIINTSHILNPRVIFLVSGLAAHKKISFANKTYSLFSDHVDIDFKTEHVTERYRKVLNLLGRVDADLDYVVSLNSESAHLAKQCIEQLRKKARNIIVLNSFAGARLRNFNFSTTVLIVRELLESPDVIVLSVANAGDHKILNSWMNDASIRSFKGRWVSNPSFSSIDMNMALVSLADLVITPDTAWVHIAGAFKKKLVAVYRTDLAGSTEVNSVIWAPYKTEARLVFAESTASNPQDINNVDTHAVVRAAFELLGGDSR